MKNKLPRIAVTIIAAAALMACLGGAFLAGYAYAVRVAARVSHISATAMLAPGFYGYAEKSKKFSCSLAISRDGRVEFTGSYGGRLGDTLIGAIYEPSGPLRLPTAIFDTVFNAKGKSENDQAFVGKDIGLRGRLLWRASRRIRRRPKSEIMWRLEGRWVSGAKLVGKYLEYRGTRFRYDKRYGRFALDIPDANISPNGERSGPRAR